MAIQPINFNYPIGSQQSVFTAQELTALELAAITAGKVDECISLVNGVEQNAIEASAIVDDMQVIQDQFVTANSDTRAELILENQEYIDALTLAKTTFDSSIQTDLTAIQLAFNTAFDTYKDTLDTDTLSYNTSLEGIIEDGETAVININASVVTEVNTKVNALINDGTIGDLINDTLLGEINTDLQSTILQANTTEQDLKKIVTILNVVENTNITTALNDAFNAMSVGEKIVVPKGTYNITNVVLIPKDGCTYDFSGVIFKAISTNGIAFKIGSDTEAKLRVNIKGLHVESTNTPAISWGNSTIGVHLINLYDCEINVSRIMGFYKNLECVGKNNIGFSYNTINIKRLDVAHYGLYLKAEAGGWCNENIFNGGAFQFTSSVQSIVDNTCYLLYVEHNAVHPLNNNHFYSPSFEGTGNAYGRAFFIDGTFNQVINCRIESIGNGFLGSNSTKNHIIVGYDNFQLGGSITDTGYGNSVTSSNYMKRGSVTTDAVITAKHDAGGTYKNFVGQIVDGTETFNVTSEGNMYLSGKACLKGGFTFLDTSGKFGFFWGGGNPNGVVTASPGSLYMNVNGGANVSMYIKETGTNTNTGWVAK